MPNLSNTDASKLVTMLLKYIGSLDVNSKIVYMKLSTKIDGITEIFYFAIMKLTIPWIMLPSLVVTTINYIIYGLGKESFYLPYPVWVSIKIQSKCSKTQKYFFFQFAIQLDVEVGLFNCLIYWSYRCVHNIIVWCSGDMLLCWILLAIENDRWGYYKWFNATKCAPIVSWKSH